MASLSFQKFRFLHSELLYALGVLFAGTSAVLKMVAGSGRPKLLVKMERDEEGVRILDIKL